MRCLPGKLCLTQLGAQALVLAIELLVFVCGRTALMLAKVRLPRAQLQPQFHALRSFNGALIETHRFWVRIFIFVAVERRRQAPYACHAAVWQKNSKTHRANSMEGRRLS